MDEAKTANSDDWARVEDDLNWILNPDNHAQGRGKMKWALEQNNVDYMGAVKDAYRESVTSPGQRAIFDSCCTENQGRVYAIGRSILERHPNWR